MGLGSSGMEVFLGNVFLLKLEELDDCAVVFVDFSSYSLRRFRRCFNCFSKGVLIWKE